MLHFIIFAQDASIALVLALSAVLLCNSNSFSRSYKNCTFITPIADICVTSVIQMYVYERCLDSKLYVCSTTFGRETIGANGVSDKLLLTFLFSDPNVDVQFLKGVGLIRSTMVSCKCGSQISWYVRTVINYHVGGSHLLPHALLPRHAGTVHGFSREFH